MDFNPRSPCGERHVGTVALPVDKLISIHALLAESDGLLADAHPDEHLFQSTLSLRRATRALRVVDIPPDDFNPRSPCGERPC